MDSIYDRQTIKTGTPQAPVMETARGFRADYSPLIAAQAPVQINSRGFVAEAGALGAVGEGLQRVGGALDQISSKMAEAINTRRVAEAEMMMDQAHADIAAEIAAEPDPAKWREITARRTAETEKMLLTKDLSPDARDAIAIRSLKWKTRTEGEVKISSARQQFALTASTLKAGYIRALDTGNWAGAADAVNTLSSGGYINPDAAAQMEIGIKDAVRQRATDSAENQFKAAIMTGDEGAMDVALQYGKEAAGWDDDYLKAKRLSGLEGIARTKAVNQSKSEAEFLGSVMMRKAQGEVIAPTQIESWVKENKIDQETGARLLVAVKSEQGAMQGEFYDFLRDEVDTYDPKTDPDGVKQYELQKRAAVLGLNRDQMGFFDARLQRAQKLNGPQRAQQAVLNAGKKVIGDMLKDSGATRTWDTDAETLLKDPVKLESFGIPAEKAKEIKTLVGGSEGGWFSSAGKNADRAKGLQLFKEQAKTRVPNKPEGLTDAEWSKMVSLVEGETTTDANATFETEFNRAVLEEGLESWYNHELNKRGTPPSEQEVKAWVGDKTRSVLHGDFMGSMFVPKESAAVRAPDGSISLRGFVDAEDLADKLPEGLAPYASTFVAAARQNGLNPYVLAAISMHETGNGTSKAFREKRNAMGISDASGPREMATVEDSINKMAASLAGKTYAKASTLEEIGGIYAPVGAANDPKKLNSYWPGGVAANYARLTH